MRRNLVAGGSLATVLVAVAVSGPLVTRGAPAPASVARPPADCADQVIHDWADNGRVGGTYDASCYLAAIRGLPEDLRAYSSAPDDLRHAFARALQAHGDAR